MGGRAGELAAAAARAVGCGAAAHLCRVRAAHGGSEAQAKAQPARWSAHCAKGHEGRSETRHRAREVGSITPVRIYDATADGPKSRSPTATCPGAPSWLPGRAYKMPWPGRGRQRAGGLGGGWAGQSDCTERTRDAVRSSREQKKYTLEKQSSPTGPLVPHWRLQAPGLSGWIRLTPPDPRAGADHPVLDTADPSWPSSRH